MGCVAFGAALLGGLAAAVLAGGIARAGVHPHEGQSLEGTRSLGDVIAEAGERPVHVIFVHGMRAEGPNTSRVFRESLCRSIGDGCALEPAPSTGRSHYIELGSAPPATYAGVPVWRQSEDWTASRPFVDRYVFSRRSGGSIVVDEVNWWPLLFPLKCQFLLRPEAELAGPDKKHLRLCARDVAPYHAWLDATDVEQAIRRKVRHAGGAKANRALKAEIMNWGLADAVIAVGPMRTYLHEAMEKAFEYAGSFEGRSAAEQEFVVISESLGSFVVIDALNAETPTPAVKAVISETHNLYFFANQFRILELARLGGIPSGADGLKLMGTEADRSPLGALAAWAQSPSGAQRPGPKGDIVRPRQIIAFNDPSDMLTFEVPQLPGAKVVNLYDRNGFDFLRLVADPLAAHTGHSRNKAVLRTVFARTEGP